MSKPGLIAWVGISVQYWGLKMVLVAELYGVCGTDYGMFYFLHTNDE